MIWRKFLAAVCVLAISVSTAFAAKPTISGGETITATLSGAITTTNPTFTIDYRDLNSDSNKSAAGSLTGVTAKTLLSATTPLTVESVSICNIDTVAATATIKRVASDGTAYTMAVVTLQANDVLTMNEAGIQVTDSAGQVKNGGGTAVTSNGIRFSEFRVHDAIASNLPATSSSDDMGLVVGTDGTDFPSLQSADFKNTTTATHSRAIVTLPANYVAGSAITIRIRGGMKTTVASSACTVDLTAYSNDGDATGSADLCTTAAQSINSLTFGDKDFTITPTGLVAGQELNLKFSFAGTDSATGTAVIATISHAELRTTCYR